MPAGVGGGSVTQGVCITDDACAQPASTTDVARMAVSFLSFGIIGIHST